MRYKSPNNYTVITWHSLTILNIASDSHFYAESLFLIDLHMGLTIISWIKYYILVNIMAVIQNRDAIKWF